jgi:hypothetical protein
MTTIRVDLEGRTYTIDLTPTQTCDWLTQYAIRGERGAVGVLSVTAGGTANVRGIERLARRKGKLTIALDGLVPGVKSPATIKAEQDARVSRTVTKRVHAANMRQLKRDKELRDRDRHTRIRSTIERKVRTANDYHLTLVHSV